MSNPFTYAELNMLIVTLDIVASRVKSDMTVSIAVQTLKLKAMRALAAKEKAVEGTRLH